MFKRKNDKSDEVQLNLNSNEVLFLMMIIKASETTKEPITKDIEKAVSGIDEKIKSSVGTLTYQLMNTVVDSLLSLGQDTKIKENK